MDVCTAVLDDGLPMWQEVVTVVMTEGLEGPAGVGGAGRTNVVPVSSFCVRATGWSAGALRGAVAWQLPLAA